MNHSQYTDKACLAHYPLMAQAISHICQEGGLTLSLDDLAKKAHLSPSHFQKLFKEYVGVSPKQFQQNLILEQAKPTLSAQSIMQTSLDLGLSSASRLHHTFVEIEAMSPGEFKAMGENLRLRYSTESSIFGPLLAVFSDRGLFYLGLHADPLRAIHTLKQSYPKAHFEQHTRLLGFDPFHHRFGQQTAPIKLHLSATNFQIQVWKALLKTEPGQRLSYQDMAKLIHKPNASRAVGTAIGRNPIAFLIPCHRIIRQTGALGGYRWGLNHKQALLSWEQALQHT